MATKDYSSKQEKMIADMLGWSVVAGSGAAACYPGDVISDDWLGECKTHVESGHKIFFSKQVWDKIKEESTVKRRFPVLFTDDGSQKSERTWCLFHCDRVDLNDYALSWTIPPVKVNISLNHEKLAEIWRNSVRELKDSTMNPVLALDWHQESIAIVPLNAFVDMFGE